MFSLGENARMKHDNVSKDRHLKKKELNEFLMYIGVKQGLILIYED